MKHSESLQNNPISVEAALRIHKNTILRHGGSHGVRDLGLLESALSSPFQTFNGEPLYGTPFHRAAQLLIGLVTNHPFIDGNKRVALAVCITYLLEEGYLLCTSHTDLYALVLQAIEGSSLEEISRKIEDYSNIIFSWR